MVTHPSTNLYLCCLTSNSLHTIILPLSYWYSKQSHLPSFKTKPGVLQKLNQSLPVTIRGKGFDYAIFVFNLHPDETYKITQNPPFQVKLVRRKNCVRSETKHGLRVAHSTIIWTSSPSRSTTDISMSTLSSDTSSFTTIISSHSMRTGSALVLCGLFLL